MARRSGPLPPGATPRVASRVRSRRARPAVRAARRGEERAGRARGPGGRAGRSRLVPAGQCTGRQSARCLRPRDHGSGPDASLPEPDLRGGRRRVARSASAGPALGGGTGGPSQCGSGVGRRSGAGRVSVLRGLGRRVRRSCTLRELRQRSTGRPRTRPDPSRARSCGAPPWSRPWATICAAGASRRVDQGRPVALRVVPGPHHERFASGTFATLASMRFSVEAASNRVGLRLRRDPRTPALRAAPGVPDELDSQGMVTGAVQVPPDGEPVILLTDHATLGGYPVVAVVATVDHGGAGSVRARHHGRARAVRPRRGRRGSPGPPPRAGSGRGRPLPTGRRVRRRRGRRPGRRIRPGVSPRWPGPPGPPPRAAPRPEWTARSGPRSNHPPDCRPPAGRRLPTPVHREPGRPRRPLH